MTPAARHGSIDGLCDASNRREADASGRFGRWHRLAESTFAEYRDAYNESYAQASRANGART